MINRIPGNTATLADFFLETQPWGVLEQAFARTAWAPIVVLRSPWSKFLTEPSADVDGGGIIDRNIIFGCS